MTKAMQDGTGAKAAERTTPERFFGAVKAHQQTEAMSRDAGYARTGLTPPAIGLDRLIVAYQ